MDFRNRGGRPANMNQTVNPGGNVDASASPAEPHDKQSKKPKRMKQLVNPINVILLFCVAIVLLGVTFLAIVAQRPDESEYVQKDKLQAVFLEGGQVYFGSISDLNDKFMRLNNIYYLRVDQQVQPEQEGQQSQQQISLAKLGCELHGPQDLMVINRDSVMFWENLKEDGQVTQAVKQFIEANPDGQDCDAQQQNGGNGDNNGSSDDNNADGTDATPPPATTPPEENDQNGQ